MTLPKFILPLTPAESDRLEAETIGEIFDEVWAEVESASDEELEAFVAEMEAAKALIEEGSARVPSDEGQSEADGDLVVDDVHRAPRHDVLILTADLEYATSVYVAALRKRSERRGLVAA